MLAAAAIAAAMVLSASGAHAAVLYSNPYDASADNGYCQWSTVCGSEQLVPDTYAAQAFSLGLSDVITSASFTELDFGDNAPTAVSWDIYSDNVSTSLPGASIASGTSSVTSTIDLGPDVSGLFDITQGTFSLPSITLGAGDYFLAIQGASTSYYDFLAQGVGSAGAAMSSDGGSTFTSTYEGVPSIAVSISGVSSVSAAPEPSIWALMILGLGAVGSLLRFGRRSGSIATA